MFPAQVLAARPGEKVLDLCAAPGGKAVKISADLAGQGLLWANEISGKRARALKHNLELAGARNALVTQEAPGQLASQLAGAFDAIMADVPCSASAMFRRTASAVRNWPLHQADYPAVQKEILLAAWQMLRPGGRLVYATCSFSLAENEEMIAWFCRQQPDCQILPIDKPAGVSDGLPVNNELRKTARIWPHLSAADGHFCALLQKKGEQKAALPSKTVPAGDGPAWQAFLDFCRTSLSRQGQHRLRQLYLESQKTARNGHLHLLPAFQLPHELKYLMPGLYLGQVRQDKRSWRFLPSFTLLLSCDCQDLARLVPAPAKSELIRRCLGGQSLVLPENLVQQKWPSGQRVAVALAEEQGCWPLSWARLAENGLLKNDLPAFLVR